MFSSTSSTPRGEMIQFDLLGTIDLRRDDGVDPGQLLRQPKRLALLAYLVTPVPGTWHRRDTLLAIFWPELDTAHARTALRNALYVLRQSLGDGVVVTRGDEDVSIDPALLSSDLDALWTAIREGRAEDALERYRGEFLPGLHPGDSEGFDSWLAAQRSRLRTEVTRLGANDADRLAREERAADALRVAQRVLEISPDETAVRRVLQLHDKLGDRAGGLVSFERFTTWLHDELGAVPSAETRALADGLRRRAATAGPGSAPGSEPIRAIVTPEPTLEATTPPRRKLPVMLSAVVTLVIVLLAGFAVRSSLSSGPQSIGKSHQVTDEEGLQIEPALSPDGETVAYAKGSAGRLSIYVERLDDRVPSRLTGDTLNTELMPRWSPHGDRIIYLSRNHAYAIPARFGTAVRVVEGSAGDGAVTSASWSPRGDSVLFVRNDSLQVKPVDGPGARVIGHGYQLHSCTWSPDGQWIACVTGNLISLAVGPLFGNRGSSGILIFRARGGEAITLAESRSLNESPTWTADSRELWFLSNRDGDGSKTFAVPVGSDGKAARPPISMGLLAHSISLGAHRIAYSDYSRVGNIYSLPLPTGELSTPLRFSDKTQVTSARRIIEIVTVSPDGKWLVYDSDSRGAPDIYRRSLIDTLGTTERLTKDSLDEFVGSISRDGDHLLYHIWIEKLRRVLVKRISDGAIEAPWPAAIDQGSPRWSPDGTAIAGWIHSEESGEIFVVRRKRGGGWNPPAWRLRDAQLPVWSPDGHTLLFVTDSGKVKRIPADSGASEVLYEPRPGTSDPRATNVAWVDARKEWWFIGNTPQGAGGIWRLPPRGQLPVLVVAISTSPSVTYGPVFDTDRKHVYFVIDERHGNVHYAELTKR